MHRAGKNGLLPGKRSGLQDVLKRLRGQAVLSESNVAEAMTEIRAALIDADVNLEIADEFIATVRQACLGTDVLRSVTPGQQAVKVVYDKMVEFMGEAEAPLASGGKPTTNFTHFNPS